MIPVSLPRTVLHPATRSLPVLLLFLLLQIPDTAVVYAQEPAPQSSSPSEEQESVHKLTDTKTDPSQKKQQEGQKGENRPQSFVPSETIDADSVLTFPTDI